MRRVEEGQDLNIGEMTYLDIRSQKKSMYGCYNNWIILQDSDPNKRLFFTKTRY